MLSLQNVIEQILSPVKVRRDLRNCLMELLHFAGKRTETKVMMTVIDQA